MNAKAKVVTGIHSFIARRRRQKGIGTVSTGGLCIVSPHDIGTNTGAAIYPSIIIIPFHVTHKARKQQSVEIR